MHRIAHIGAPSALQQGMLFHALREPGMFHHIEQGSCELTGALETERFRTAWQAVLGRHEALRTAFSCAGLTRPARVVYENVGLPFLVLDASDRDPEVLLEAEVQRHRAELACVDSPPLLRLTLIRVSDRRHRALWSIHHLVHDAWSLEIILSEVFAIYSGERLPRAPQYSEFVRWQKANAMPDAPEFWRARFAGYDRSCLLRRKLDDGRGYGHAERLVDPKTLAELKRYATGSGVTFSVLCTAVWAAWLSLQTQRDDIAFGTVMLGRPASLAGADRMVGAFINTVPLRARISDSIHLRHWLAELQQCQARMGEFESCALSDIRNWLQWPPAMPLLESIFVYQNVFENMGRRTFRELSMDDLRLQGHSSYPLMLRITPAKAARVELVYRRSYFSDTEAEHALQQCVEGLEGFAAGAASPTELRARLAEGAHALDRERSEQRRTEFRERLKAKAHLTTVCAGAVE